MMRRNPASFFTVFLCTLATACGSSTDSTAEKKIESYGSFIWESVEMKVYKPSNCRINPWNESGIEGAGQPAEMPRAQFEIDLGPHCEATEAGFLKLFSAMADHGQWSPEDRKYVLMKADLCPSAEGSEWIAAFIGSHYCGSGGCTLFLFYADMTPMHKVTVAGHGPTWISGTLENGWYPLLLDTREGYMKVDLSSSDYLLNSSMAKELDEETWNRMLKRKLGEIHRDKMPF